MADQSAAGGKGKKTGKHPKERLSAVFVRQVKETGRYADGAGLYLTVDPSGAKRWMQRIVIRQRRRDLGLGSTDHVSLADARMAAAVNRAVARANGDPLAEKRRAASMPTFAEAARKAHAEIAPALRSEKARTEFLRTLDKHVFPAFGTVAVNEVNSSDVRRVILLVREKTPEVARKLLVRIRQVFNWSVAEKHRHNNPATKEALALPKWASTSSHYPAVSLTDLPRWWADLTKRDGASAAALQFAVLTAARSGEARGMTWAEVDLDAALWTVPALRMKSKREHRVPLSGAALDLLKSQPLLHGSPLVFPAPRGGMLSDMSISAVMRRMQKAEEANGRPGWCDSSTGRPAVPHGLRSSFRDWTAECGYEWAMSEMALAHHVGSQAERAYRRSDMLDRRRVMMQAWADFVKGKTAAKVVQLHG